MNIIKNNNLPFEFSRIILHCLRQVNKSKCPTIKYIDKTYLKEHVINLQTASRYPGS